MFDTNDFLLPIPFSFPSVSKIAQKVASKIRKNGHIFIPVFITSLRMTEITLHDLARSSFDLSENDAPSLSADDSAFDLSPEGMLILDLVEYIDRKVLKVENYDYGYAVDTFRRSHNHSPRGKEMVFDNFHQYHRFGKSTVFVDPPFWLRWCTQENTAFEGPIEETIAHLSKIMTLLDTLLEEKPRIDTFYDHEIVRYLYDVSMVEEGPYDDDSIDALLDTIVQDRKKFVQENIIDKFVQGREKNVEDNYNGDFPYPDMYILLGFARSPSYTVRVLSNNSSRDRFEHCTNELWNHLQYNKSMNYLLGTCCFLSQVCGPIYYIYHYVESGNSLCPDDTNILTKVFAISYFFMLYAQFPNMWSDMYMTLSNYSGNHLVKHDGFILFSFVTNHAVLFIIPLFTYVLFLENSRIIDLILNCLTGTFLIELDNSIISFTSEKIILKSIIQDREVISFLDKGYKKNPLLEIDSTISRWFSVIGIMQIFVALSCIFSLSACL